eukprot:TRINITY_DN10626_c0_g1_i1.p1 TRINITY_DN10626_c0_g1~~TRINITY_DN10626_c0_g1_i1.p1  ORF type:complete len:110 (-),score=8.83 TRINITY_DN10626_c0_g1_i1:93-422(-)
MDELIMRDTHSRPQPVSPLASPLGEVSLAVGLAAEVANLDPKRRWSICGSLENIREEESDASPRSSCCVGGRRRGAEQGLTYRGDQASAMCAAAATVLSAREEYVLPDL